MKTSVAVAFAAALMALAVEVAEGVECYDCAYGSYSSLGFSYSGSTDAGCESISTMDKWFGGGPTTTTCNGQCTKVESALFGSSAIIRTCVPTCLEIHTSVYSQYCCSDDKCNHGNMMHVSGPILLIVALTSIWHILERV